MSSLPGLSWSKYGRIRMWFWRRGKWTQSQLDELRAYSAARAAEDANLFDEPVIADSQAPKPPAP